MKYSLGLGSALVGVVLLSACGSDDSETSPATGGAAGMGASGGSAGAAGSGTGGTSGSGGSTGGSGGSTGGSAGMGTGGSAGMGTGGSAGMGTGGSAGMGTGGSAGMGTGGSAGMGTGGSAGMGSGGTGGGTGGTGGMPGTNVAFRANQLAILDPHLHYQAGGSCLGDINTAVNAQINTAVTSDGDMDNLLDLSLVMQFRPLDQANGGALRLIQADCTSPMSSTSCSQTMGTTNLNTSYAPQTGGTCLGVIASQLTAGYNPAPQAVTGPCFVTPAVLVNLAIGGFTVPLRGARLAARYNANPATALSNGLLRGFLRQSDAQNITLPATIPVVGGRSLSSLLCNSDRETSGGVQGWMFYVGFSGPEVPFM